MNQANIIRVKLTKRKKDGLGFMVKSRTIKPYVIISDLIAGGLAEGSGLVQVGDTILRINDIDVTDLSYDVAVV